MAIALVAHIGTGLGGTGGTTSAIDTTGANLLVVGVSFYGNITPTVSDSKVNTWTGLTQTGGSTNQSKLYYAKAATVGSGHTFTVSGGDGNFTGFESVYVLAFSGADTASPFDQQSASSGASNSTTTQPGSITPSVNNEVLVTVLGFDQNAGTTSIDIGFTKLDSVAYAGGLYEGGASGYLIETTATAKNPTWTLTNSALCSCAIASFKAAAGTTGNLFLPSLLEGLGSGGPFFQNPLG